MSRFTRDAFLQADASARLNLCEELSAILSSRIRDADDFHTVVRAQIEELRKLGHDLWNYDDEDHRQVWCADYTKALEQGICVTFTREAATVEWSGG